MKKVICLVLVLVLSLTAVIGLTGCGKDASSADKLTVWGGINSTSTNAKIDEVTAIYHEAWEGYTDAEIEWVDGDIKMIMASGDYPDVIMKAAFQNQDVAKYAAQGVLVPLEDYINEKDTPNIWKMFNEVPTAKATSTSADGHIYALPTYIGRPETFIETYWYINTDWLNKLGFEKPTTLDELYDVLVAFKTKDPNGNGKADEIPFTFKNEGAFNYPETLLSAWGVSTKFGMYDGWMNIVDGKARFTPLLDEWKEMCRFYNKLWENGLLDVEAFTQESAQFSSKCQSVTPVVGVTFAKQNPFNNPDHYEVIKPLSADGKIKPIMHIHPGYIGNKGFAFVTSNCKDVKTAMQFLDGFYDTDETIKNWYGTVGEDRTFAEKNADGMYIWNEPEEGQTEINLYSLNTLYGPNIIGYLPADAVGTKLESAPFFEEYEEMLELYRPYIDQETWPRPYYSADDAARVNELLTDLTNYVEQMKANFITGKVDIDEGWDVYIENLKKIGAEEYQKINQKTYDVYLKAYNDMIK